ncbi:MAG: chemotaxis-specific protein-glutamate methyltransferase CheB [Armatimonadota bacterium]
MRVLVVDDSVFARKMISDILVSSPLIEVVGFARDGVEALKMIPEIKPDVVTLDVEMPRLDGIETLRRLMNEYPTPTVMLSALTTAGASKSIEALKLGAVDVMAKPNGSYGMGLDSEKDELISKVLTAARVQVSKLLPTAQVGSRRRIVSKAPTVKSFPIVIIASSTGGPKALRTIVPNLTLEQGCAYVVVQHLPEGFSGPLVRDLDALTDLNVRESEDDYELRPGDMLFAKAGLHTVFSQNGMIRITTDPPLWGVRPSADVTMASAAPVFGDRLVGVVLTGMGRDGANGIRAIKDAGGIAIAEHESSCIVYGMPRSAVETGVVDFVVPLLQIPSAIRKAVLKIARRISRSAA